jgi:maleate isomerase
MRDGFEMGRIDPTSLPTATEPMADADIDGLFISGAALNLSPVLNQLEELVRKPVITSNKSMAWHAPRPTGIEDEPAIVGRYPSVLDISPDQAAAVE